MRARLRLNHEGVTVLLVVTVEEHLAVGGAVFDWEEPLRDSDRDHGVLMLEDGRRLKVVVDGAFLCQCGPAP
jgi:hypothetical protein